jgi:hypothetical protein
VPQSHTANRWDENASSAPKVGYSQIPPQYPLEWHDGSVLGSGVVHWCCRGGEPWVAHGSEALSCAETSINPEPELHREVQIGIALPVDACTGRMWWMKSDCCVISTGRRLPLMPHCCGCCNAGFLVWSAVINIGPCQSQAPSDEEKISDKACWDRLPRASP